MNEQVVITGVGLVSPLGQDLDTVIRALRTGKACRGVTKAYPSGRSRPAASLPEIDFVPLLGRQGLKYHSLNTLVLAQACLLAFQDARLTPDQVDPDLRLIVGSAIGNHGRSTRYLRMISRDGPGAVNPMDGVDTAPNSPADFAAIRLNAMGSLKMVSTGACSGLDAVIEGSQQISAGQARTVVAAGFEGLYPEMVDTFARKGCLGPDEALPQDLGRPYDQASQGMLLGEGAAALVLERADTARARGVRSRARVLGGASLFGPLSGLTRPVGTLGRTVALALEAAGCGPEGIDWVCGSANGMPAQDRLELLALSRIFDPAPRGPAVSSIKAAWGDAFGAAGALAAAAAVGCMENSVIPATLGLEAPRPEGRGLNLVAGNALAKEISRVLILCRDAAGFCSGLVMGHQREDP